MEGKKAHNISVVLVGLGIILLLLPVFDMFQGWQQALLFAGLICFLGSFMIRQLAKRG
jgi:uncharacterized membrane protein YgdD (TMEM256/DUF423 family)